MAAKKRTRPRTWYVYTYAYPDGIVFYVGKGKDGRIFDHEQEAEGGCPCRKCRTIREIWLSGKPIKKRIEYETLSEQDALVYEWNLINLYDSPLLTNVPRRPIAEISQDVPEEYLRIEQAARAIGRSPAALYNYMNVLRIVKYRLPSRVATTYLLQSDVERIKQFIEKNRS